MSQIKKGAVLNYVSIGLTNVVGLVMTPFILTKLGKDEYGIYLAIGALIGTISLLDFGLNNTIVRFVAKYRAEKDKKGEENFLATTMIIYSLISTLVLIIGFIFYKYIDSYFTKMNPEEIRIAKVLFLLLMFNLAISLPGKSFTGICMGYEAFVFPKAIAIIRYILRSLTFVAVLLLGGRAIGLVIAETVFSISVILVTAFFVFKKLKVRFKLHSFKTSFVKRILNYSVWIFVFSLVSIFQWKAGHWVLGRISEPGVLTIYGLGITLGTYYGAFSTAISGLFLPRAVQMSVSNASSEQLTDMMIKIGRIAFILLMYIFIAFAFFGQQFISLWVGKNLSSSDSFNIYLIALMIMVAYTLPLIQNFGNSILEAKNKLSFKALLYLGFMLLGTGLGYILALKYGAVGMMFGSVAGWIIAQNIMNVYYHKKMKLNIPRFFKELSSKTLLTVFLISGIAYLLNFLPGSGWVNFIIKGASYTIVFATLMFLLGMLDYEKDLFKKPVLALVRKI